MCIISKFHAYNSTAIGTLDFSIKKTYEQALLF